jgi:ABC-type oligopeptide transport system ATPase subunit
MEGVELVKRFFSHKSRHHIDACRRVSIVVARGHILGLVGESGCGKTTVGRLLMRLIDPDSGEVRFRGRLLTGLSEQEIRPIRRHFQMIFQDSGSAFNPRIRVYDSLKETIKLHGGGRQRDLRERILDLIGRVNLSRGILYNYVGNLSDGEVKRLDVARALSIDPQFLIADEPLSRLDMSIQSQIANLLMEVKEEGTGILFISHDLRMVEMLSSVVAVMYRGMIVERAPKREITGNPLHPYTRHLWDPQSSVFYMGLKESGCIYRNSCALYQGKGFPMVCAEIQPPLVEHTTAHFAACHFAGE